MTGEQLALDCDPTWTDPKPTDRTPTPWDIRQAEISDLRHQGAPLIGIHRAHRELPVSPTTAFTIALWGGAILIAVIAIWRSR